MDMRKETRRIILVPINLDGVSIIEYDAEQEWIESVAPFNESTIQVVMAGVVSA